MNKSTGIILGAMGVILVGFFGWAIWHNQKTNYTDPNTINGYVESLGINYTTYESEIAAYNQKNNLKDQSSDRISIGEHVEGNPDAEVILFEYSDYQCSGCASVVDDIAELLQKYGDQIAIVHRTYVLSYHTNGVAAATAVEAAGLQGYWKEYGDYLFANQEDWYYSDSTEREEQFYEYFTIVTGGQGDLELFKQDFAGEVTKAKVESDIKLSKSVSDKIQYTPAFFIDGEFIDWAYDNEEDLSFVDYFSNIIDAKLAK